MSEMSKDARSDRPPGPSSIRVTLSSGAHYVVAEVMLFDGEQVQQARALQGQAMRNLQGVSSGIGFWGSPGWVIGGALTLGFLENLASGSAAQEGIKQLAQVERLTDTIRANGIYVRVSSIEHICYPILLRSFTGCC